MEKSRLKIAKYLLQSKAIKLQPTNPFTWASGWKSPIYCDNRTTLSYHEIRTAICQGFIALIKEKYPNTEAIAGVATGAIAQAILVAQEMQLPMLYVRPEPKSHGLGNQIEGKLEANTKVVVIEDLISTGGSSLKAVKAIREAGGKVLGMCAIFSYGFALAKQNFVDNHCNIDTITNYNTVIELAAQTGYITEADIDALKAWRENPGKWGK